MLAVLSFLPFATEGSRTANRSASASMPSINSRTDTTSLITPAT
jgi:hypothetical protein